MDHCINHHETTSWVSIFHQQMAEIGAPRGWVVITIGNPIIFTCCRYHYYTSLRQGSNETLHIRMFFIQCTIYLNVFPDLLRK